MISLPTGAENSNQEAFASPGTEVYAAITVFKALAIHRDVGHVHKGDELMIISEGQKTLTVQFSLTGKPPRTGMLERFRKIEGASLGRGDE